MKTIKKITVKKAQAGKKVVIGAKSVGRPMPANPGEAGKNFGKSDAGKLKPTMGGAKNGKKMKNGGTLAPTNKNVPKSRKQATFKSGGMVKGKCKNGC